MKYFTLEEANSILPLLRSITQNIVDGFKELDRRKNSPMDEETPDEMNALVDRLNDYTKELEALGCYIEVYRQGVVTLPTLYRGRRVLFCTCPLIEDKIKFFHEIDETCGEKQEIDNHNYFLCRRDL